jgi:hypothetical protein
MFVLDKQSEFFSALGNNLINVKIWILSTSFQIFKLWFCYLSLLLLVSCSAPKWLNISKGKVFQFLIAISKGLPKRESFITIGEQQLPTYNNE